MKELYNLQDKLNAKQDVIGEESLAQTKVFNLVASLAAKQDNIGNSDFFILVSYKLPLVHHLVLV